MRTQGRHPFVQSCATLHASSSFSPAPRPTTTHPNDTTLVGRGPAWTLQLRLPHPSRARVWGRQVARSAAGASTTGGGSYVGDTRSDYEVDPADVTGAFSAPCASSPGLHDQRPEPSAPGRAGFLFVSNRLCVSRRKLASHLSNDHGVQIWRAGTRKAGTSGQSVSGALEVIHPVALS